MYPELNGRLFSDLTEEQQETIKDYALNVHAIGRGSPPDFVFEVFERLNMGATQLNEQELRNCIYGGSYSDLLAHLCRVPAMLRLNRLAAPHLRMKDREMVLRFFALLRNGPAGFSSPVKAWLNEEMRTRRELPPAEAARMADAFDRAIGLAESVFGDAAFRPPKAEQAPLAHTSPQAGDADDESGAPLLAPPPPASPQPHGDVGDVNIALWDTLMHSLATCDPAAVLSRRDAVAAAFSRLASNPKFRRLLVSQPKAVVARAAAWDRVLAGVLAGKEGSSWAGW